MKKIKISTIVLNVFAWFWSIVTLYPLLVTFLSSLKDNEEIFGNMFALPTKMIWQNYADALFSANMIRSIGNSLFLAALTTVCVVLVGMLAAYILARQECN